MWKSVALAILAGSVFSPSFAETPDTFDQGMNTLWEVLWHQSGTATRLVRWEQDIKVRVYGVDAAQHRAFTLQALHAAADVAGVKVIDVTDAPDAARQANVSIEITPDNALDDAQPCETRLNFATETHIDSVTMQMRNNEVQRCAYHESMHVMGVRGHPGGDTVLSYFTAQSEGLQALDKVMLRAWYSPRAHGGMTPFEVLPILGDELVAIMPDQAEAKRERDSFIARTVEDMQAFADGQGDIPEIVKECGKSSADGIRFGRMEMGYFLGVAYGEGVSVKRDPALAATWLKRAATMGSRSAQALLGAGAALPGAHG